MNSSGKALAAAVGLLASALLMVAVATIPPFAVIAAVLDCVLIGATCALVFCSIVWMVLKMRYHLSQRRQK